MAGIAVRGSALMLILMLVPFTWIVFHRALRLQAALHGHALQAQAGRAKHPADFRVVLCRDHNFLRGRQVAITSRKLGTVFIEDYLIVIRLNPSWLEPRRPDLAAFDIAQENVGAPIITRRIFPPARDGELSPAAVARTGRGDHHRITTV